MWVSWASWLFQLLEHRGMTTRHNQVKEGCSPPRPEEEQQGALWGCQTQNQWTESSLAPGLKDGRGLYSWDSHQIRREATIMPWLSLNWNNYRR
jgi:hypothetical protein